MNAPSPAAAPTLTALMDIQRRVDRQITYLEGESEVQRVPFGQLFERALGILHHLQRLGARPGDKLILFLGSNEPFIDAFWAAVLGGIIPVPVAPGISDEHRHKVLRIAHKLKTPYLYTEQRLLDRIANFAAEHGESGAFELLRRRTFLIDALADVSRAGQIHRAAPSDTAFIQFSSGSTSEPKGVVLSHANLMANIRGVAQAAQFTDRDVSLSWMPLTHDMGLIGFHLMMFASSVHCHLMPTELFVRRPLLWLQLATRIQATILCSPNFGYRHYLKVLGERGVDGLDLASVRLIFNGAEPISVELCDEFMHRLAPARLAPASMFPVYGLAEASLAVSFPPPGRPYRAACFDRHRLGIGVPAVPVAADAPGALRLVSVGGAIPYCELRLADADDRDVPAQRVGHIQIRGDNVTRGYFDDAATNAATFTADGWLRTGDLGLMHDNELYITGRHKEILFVNGQNYYPYDIERIAEQVPGLELGKVVVAGVRPPGADTDELVVFLLHRGALEEFLPLATEVARRIGEHAGLEVAAVVPVRRIPKTTSGKVQRHLLEQEYVDGLFAEELAGLARLRAAHVPSVPAGHDLEEQLRALCSAELDGRALDVDQNLFDIGASSIKLIAIHERIEQAWPGRIEVADIFDHPSIRHLAQLLTQRLRAGTGAGAGTGTSA